MTYLTYLPQPQSFAHLVHLKHEDYAGGTKIQVNHLVQNQRRALSSYEPMPVVIGERVMRQARCNCFSCPSHDIIPSPQGLILGPQGERLS